MRNKHLAGCQGIPFPLRSRSKSASLEQASQKKARASCSKGMPPGETKQAAAPCDYAVISADTLKNGDIIRIEGEGRAGTNTVPRRIDVTYKVQKLSEASS